MICKVSHCEGGNHVASRENIPVNDVLLYICQWFLESISIDLSNIIYALIAVFSSSKRN